MTLSISNLHVSVGDKPILKGLTLEVPAGEVHAVMGPNGAGKSTLGYVLSGRPGYEATDGSVAWNGEDLLELEPAERAAKAEKGVARWRAVARSAAKQARRAYVPEIHDLVTTRELVPLLTSMDANVVVLHEGSAVPLGEVDFSVTETVVIVVGPEGGISPEELDALVGMGAQPALLGPTVLRTSTAAAVALGALGVMTDRWSGTPPD